MFEIEKQKIAKFVREGKVAPKDAARIALRIERSTFPHFTQKERTLAYKERDKALALVNSW